MKKLNFQTIFALLGVIFFSSCEREEGEISREIQRITFENVELNAEGFQYNFPNGLILYDLEFYNYYDEVWSSWEGFAVSRKTDRQTPGHENQFSVYASSGANGSENFAIVHAGFNQTSYLQFRDNQEFQFKSLMINNSTFAALEIRNGGAFTRKFEEGDWFKIIITGFDSAGKSTGKVEFYLADFRNGRRFICQEWTEVNLTSLGKVNRLEFTFDSTDYNVWGVNTPMYACIDEIVYFVS